MSLSSRLVARQPLLLAAITLLAAFFRFYRLDALPPGFHFDQAFYVFDALRLLQGQFSLFFAAPGGSEPLYPYLATVGVAVLGPNTPFGLKITSALLGVVTIPLIYLLARTLFRSTRLALLAALLAAISSWHIFYSRDGERLTLLVLLAAITFLFVWRAVERRRRRDYVLTGVFLGLALYTYPAARILPLAVVMVMLFAAWEDRPHPQAQLRGLVIVLAVGTLVFLPLGAYYALHPSDFIAHTAQVSVLASPAGPLRAISDNALRVLGMFLFKGDGGIIRNVPGRPIFDPLVGAFFVVGVILLAVQLFRPRTPPADRRRALLLAAWIVLALALSLLSDDAPNNGRTVIALPAVMMLPAWGMTAIVERVRTPRARQAAWAGLAVLLAASGLLSFQAYFVTFANLPDLYYAFNVDKVELANWINANQSTRRIYLAPLFYQTGTISLLTRNARLKSFDSRDTVVLPGAAQGQEADFGFPVEQEQRAQTLAARLGTLGTRETLAGSNGAPLLWLYRVPARNLPGLENPLSVLAGGGPFVQPQTTERAVWDDHIALLGYRVEPQGPGGRNLTVTLFLQALRAMTQDYTFSIKVRDARNRVWGQEDKFPGDNSYPTSAWDQGDLIIEKFYPGLDPCAPAGQYHLTVEAYDPGTGQVLAVAEGGENAVALGTMEAGDSQGNLLQDLQPEHELNLDLTPRLHLLGLTEMQSGVRAGDALALELFWKGTGGRAEIPVTLSLRDASGGTLLSVQRTISLPAPGRGLCTLFDLQTPASSPAGAAGVFVNDTRIDSIEITR